ncbi:hypothetical protein TRIP_B330193 [uncultured Desulfatiglans sp.]|nr:hypothetical protein TRIP_B330193 [uncultured Desulfatiglans sp.]
MANIKAIERLRGGDLDVAAQADMQIIAGIGLKDHFRMETRRMRRSGTSGHDGRRSDLQ